MKRHENKERNWSFIKIIDLMTSCKELVCLFNNFGSKCESVGWSSALVQTEISLVDHLTDWHTIWCTD